jgi:glucokinase
MKEGLGMSANGGAPPVVGIDLGGTKILAAVVSADNTILGRDKQPTPAQEGAEAILKAVLDCVDGALADAGLRREDLAAVGVGSPGPLDVETGTILFSANLNVRDFKLGPLLSQALGRPVLVHNDVRVGGYGEFRLGAGRGYRNLIAVFVGTGIGGCLVQEGRVVNGSTGNAGEVGHIIVKAGGPQCGCGQHGCMEALASRTAITRRVNRAIQKGHPTALAEKIARKGGRLKSGDLAAAVDAGDHIATKEVRRAARYLGLGLGSLINVFGPEIVIIGGGVAGALGDPWIELVRASARTQTLADPLGKIRIEPAALGDDAGILGASLLARERFCGSRVVGVADRVDTHEPSGELTAVEAASNHRDGHQ